MPDWLAQTTGMSQGSAQLLAVVLAMLIIAVLIAVCIPLLKRFARTSYKGSRSRQPRLAIMDTTDIDARRRLLLVRRDNVEHLIMIGGANDLVVEQGIMRGVPVSTPTRGPAFAGGMQPVTAPVTTETNPPADTSATRPHWAEEPEQKAAETTAPLSSAPPAKQAIDVKPASPVKMQSSVAPSKPAMPASATERQVPQRPLKPAPAQPANASGKPAALQTPTIGGTRPVQKIAPRPITARPAPARKLGVAHNKPAAKPVAPGNPKAQQPPVTAEQSKQTPQTEAKTSAAPETEAQTAAKPIPPAAMRPPMNGPAAKAASAFMRPRVTETPVKPQDENKKEEPKQEDQAAKPAEASEQTPASALEKKPQATPEKDAREAAAPAKSENAKAGDKTPTTTDKPRQAKQPKEKEEAPKPETAKAPSEKSGKKPKKENPEEAMDGIAKEMADLLDDIEAHTK